MTIIKVENPIFTSNEDVHISVECLTDQLTPVTSGKLSCILNNNIIVDIRQVKQSKVEFDFKLPEKFRPDNEYLIRIEYSGSPQAEEKSASTILLYEKSYQQDIKAHIVVDDYYSERNAKFNFTSYLNTDNKEIIEGTAVLKINNKTIGKTEIINNRAEIEFDIPEMLLDQQIIFWKYVTNRGIFINTSILYLSPKIPVVSSEYSQNKIFDIKESSFDDLNLNNEKFEHINCVGLDNYLFLTNDTNYELTQHYSQNFKNKFDEEAFRKSYASKEDYCKKRGIDYRFYVVPDKSIVCKDYLPITPKIQKRNCDLVKDLIEDHIEVLTPQDYYKSDTHINFNGGLKYSAQIMHDIDSQLSSQKYLELMKENLVHRKVMVDGDLCTFKNPDDSKKEVIDRYDYPLLEQSSQYDFLHNSFKIPEKFAKVGKRESVYLKNRFSLTNKKCLLLRDSTAIRFLNPLNVFFNSIFAYWDHWNFNKELVEWYKPDIIIEIRTERFLEKMKYDIV